MANDDEIQTLIDEAIANLESLEPEETIAVAVVAMTENERGFPSGGPEEAGYGFSQRVVTDDLGRFDSPREVILRFNRFNEDLEDINLPMEPPAHPLDSLLG